MTKMLTIETFKADARFVRKDVNVFGRATYGFGRHQTCAYFAWAWVLFVNSYRWAPVMVKLITHAGRLQQAPAPGLARICFNGSIRDPRASWSLRLGRSFIGGTTPGWVKRQLAARDERRWQAAAAEYDAAQPEYDEFDEAYFRAQAADDNSSDWD